MKHLVAATAVILLTSMAIGQEIKHAPTTEQCKADAALWAQVEYKDLDGVKYPELKARYNELNECASIGKDTHNLSIDDLRNLVVAERNILWNQIDRLTSFMAAHGDWKLFLQADEMVQNKSGKK